MTTIRLRFRLVLLSVVFLLAKSWCHSATQALTPASKAGEPSKKVLVGAQSVVATSELANYIAEPVKCDSNGNIYITTDQWGISAVHKLNAKGERLAMFQPNSDASFKVAMAVRLSIANDGRLYQLVALRGSGDPARYVLVYSADGSNQTRIKLQPGFFWHTAAVAVFASGNMLITGQQFFGDSQRANVPFTGVFSPDGKLVHEVRLEDDEAILHMTEVGDVRVVSPFDTAQNRAVGFSQMELARDGNIYLMRWLNPAIVYAISPEGKVVRRFTVDPGNDNLRPAAMHIASGRVAVLFVQPQSEEKTIKIVDLEGRELASYGEPERDGKMLNELGGGFACYVDQPERFTFLGSDDAHRLKLVIAEPR